MTERDWQGVAERLSADTDEGCEMLALAKHVKRAGASAGQLARWVVAGHPSGVRLEAVKVGRGWKTTAFAIERFLGAVTKAMVAGVAPIEAPRRTRRRAALAAEYADKILRGGTPTAEELRAVRFARQAQAGSGGTSS